LTKRMKMFFGTFRRGNRGSTEEVEEENKAV
jgi:hypothetical protein